MNNFQINIKETISEDAQDINPDQIKRIILIHFGSSYFMKSAHIISNVNRWSFVVKELWALV
jgi:hypothetical protein